MSNNDTKGRRPEPDGTLSFTVALTDPVGTATRIFRRMIPPSVRPFVLLAVALVVLYQLVYHGGKELFLSGLVQSYYAGDDGNPQWSPANSYRIRHGTSTSTLTDSEGAFKIPVGHLLLPWLFDIDLTIRDAQGAYTVSLPNSQIWKFLPPLRRAMVFHAPDTAKRFFLSRQAATTAYEERGSFSTNPTDNNAEVQPRDGLLSFLTTVHALQQGAALPPGVTPTVVLDSLALTSSPRTQDMLVEAELDGLNVFSQSVFVNESTVPLASEPISYQTATNDELLVTFTAPSLLPFMGRVLARCRIDLGSAVPGTRTTLPCSEEDDAPVLSFQVVPALSVGCYTRQIGPAAYGALFWLDVGREDLAAVENVTYDLGPLYRPREVTTPRIDERDFYMYSRSLYTSALPVTTRVELASGFIWPVSARILRAEALVSQETRGSHP